MDLPQGYPRKGDNQVCKLNKSIYGLRQASRQWFHKFFSALLANGFTQSKHDFSLFHISANAAIAFLLVYVDDRIISSPDKHQILLVQCNLESLFKLNVLGDIEYFLGLEVAKGICLSQHKYALSLLEDTGFLDCKPTSVPMDPSLRFLAHDGDPVPNPALSRCIIG